MQPVNIEHSDANDEDWSRVSSPPSFIKELPEFVKLILASLFVALVVHAFFASRRNAINEAQRGPSVHGRVGAIGSNGGGSVNRDDGNSSSEDGGISDRNDRNDVSNNGNDSGGQALGGAAAAAEPVPEEAATATTNKGKGSAKARAKAAKKSSQNAVAERNYDALICKKASESDDDGNEGDGGEIILLMSQNKKREQPSTSMSISKEKKQSPKPNTIDAEKVPADTTISQHDDESTPQTPPPIELKSKAHHPGLQGYYNWHATITSLYRIYAIPTYEVGNNNDHDHNDSSNRKYHQAILPMHPSSERGQVPLYIEVTNRTSHPRIDVYWIDYKGNEVRKGSIPNRGGVWSQTTFVGHPWTFRVGEGEENVLVKYAPFRIIPTIAGAETSRVESSGNVEGMQKFVIRDVKEGHVMRWNDGLAPVCLVEDEILPEPPLVPSIRSASNTSTFTTVQINNAIQWSCQQIQREDAIYQGNGINSAKRLLQYLKNICLHPDDPKYRRLRLGNHIFQETIYNTGARGVLLALGFEELYGCMECGPGGGKMLPHERIQQISDAMMVVNRTLKVMEGGNGNGEEGSGALAQPEGGDGFGRAGFGHAGGMNL